MKISLDWLKEYIDLDKSTDEIADVLTATGLEVEGLETYHEIQGNLEGLVIGEVLTCQKHPNADKLSVTTVDIGEGEPSPIVCGAPNVAAGQKVVVAKVNATLYPEGGEAFKIKKAKIRGEVSQGMICAEDEIGLGSNHDGIIVLDTDLPNGTPAVNYFKPFQDTIVEIGLTPNRADAASHLGVARDLKAAYNKEIKWPATDGFSVDNTSNDIEVIVENQEACPRYSALTISNVEVRESPRWLQNRLKTIGLVPINNVVDTTNYVLHSLGQPMHAFDADQISGRKVVVKTMPEGSTFTTLDDKERKLYAEDLMICNDTDGMCIAGVFGGIKSGVTEATKNIFLESAYFSADYVRKTATRHGLKTDASFRYERGTDPNMTVKALKLAAVLIREMTGGEISSDIIDVYPEPIGDTEVSVSFAHVDRLIGKQIPRDRIKEILEHLDISVKEGEGDQILCTVPAYRVDVKREADVIEEILRIYGYNNIELEENYGTDYLANFPKPDKDKLQEKVTTMLASIGFNEIITNSLTNPEYVQKANIWNPEENVEVLNKLSLELGVLRQSLIFSGLESLKYNVNRRQENLKFFEFGRTYKIMEGKYKEEDHLVIFMTGNQSDESWLTPTSQVGFHDLSSVVLRIIGKFKPANLTTQPTTNPCYEYGLDAISNGVTLATFGALKYQLVQDLDLKQTVMFADVNWPKLQKQGGKKILYKPVSKFPEVRRDLSVVVKKEVTFDDIRKLAETKGNRLIKNINVFSVYEGEKIDADNKSYALSFILQDESKTLTDKQIDRVMNGLIQSFEQNLNAIIRK